MGYSYPNGAFSVILDVPNNQYAGDSIDNYNQFLKEKSGFDSLEEAFDQAKNRLSNIYTNQLQIYQEVEKKLRKASGDTNFNLQQILNNSLGSFGTFTKINFGNEESTQALNLKGAQATLKDANRKFKVAFEDISIRIASSVSPEEINLYLDQADEAVQKLGKAFLNAYNEIEDVKKRIDRLHNKITNASKSNLSFQQDANGDIIIGGDKISAKTKEAFANYQKFLKDNKKFGKGLHYRAGRAGTDENTFSYQRKKHEENLALALEKDLAQEPDKQNIEDVMDIIYEILGSGKILPSKEINKKVNTAQESGYILESVANLELRNILKNLLSKDVIINGGSVTEKTRIMLRMKAVVGKKDKDQIKKFLKEIEQNMLNEYENIIDAFNTLDKIDDYITLDFKNNKNNKTDSYVLAFSDKLYKDITNISILTGREEREDISGASTLLNSYDIISRAGMAADAFIFTALNAARASVFYSLNAQRKIAELLKQLLSTFIYEIAYNPESFVEQVLQKDLSSAKVVYFHRIGSQSVPSFIIIKNLMAYLEKVKQNIKTDPIVKVALSFDTTPAQEYINQLSNEDESYNNKTYSKAAWNYVATQVAEQTYLNIHLNLLPAALDITSNWLEI